MNINVNPKGLYNFANYVADFSTKITGACDTLSDATDAYAGTVSPEDAAADRAMVAEIKEIVNSAAPTLTDIQTKVLGYAALVKKLKAIAQGG